MTKKSNYNQIIQQIKQSNNNNENGVDFSKYARPELIEAASAVANFLGDGISSILSPPVVLVVVTFVLDYVLPFSSSFRRVLFLVVGVIGGLITGLLYGTRSIIHLAAGDAKKVVTEIIRLVTDIIEDISSYSRDPSTIPPVSELVRGAIKTLVIPVITGVLKSKLYGRIILLVANPILKTSSDWLLYIISSFESKSKKSDSSTVKTVTTKAEPTRQKQDRMIETLNTVKKIVVPKIDALVRKFNMPLFISSLICGAITFLCMLGIYTL
eukprot:TRINITY_DN1332_c0_g1_i1.p1 TRINITY_DN1332_c0_g1~~TRINITY_DN1332_c0_g1_i1.p1  ORF type:complete len:269 (-),score=66.02 TRINITY_DN1332_c0_g1_i1:32-838(-)